MSDVESLNSPIPSAAAPTTNWFWAMALAMLVVIAYWPARSGGFISDDVPHIEQSTVVQSPDGLSDIWFRWGAVPQYYPVTHSVFWAEYQMWGINPAGYHAINIVLHAVAAILAWRVLVALAVPGAWLGAALFAVHPVEAESVAWISELKNVLSMVLALGSILAYLRFSPADQNDSAASGERDAWWYELSVGLYVAAVLSKSVTVSVPAVLLVIFWWKRGRITRRDVLQLAPFFALGMAMAYVTVWVEKTYIGALGEDWNISFVQRVLLASHALWFYAWKLVWPYPLSFYYPRWDLDTSDAWQYVYLVAFIALVATLWAARRVWGRGPLAAVLIFAGVLTPALGFFDIYPFRIYQVADHYQYHASLALLALAAAGGALAVQHFLSVPALAGRLLAGSVIALLALLTFQHSKVFADHTRLYAHAIEVYPDSWIAHFNLGAHLQQLGRPEDGIEHYREALRIVPPEQWHRTVGPALQYAEDPQQAITQLERALTGELSDRDKSDVHGYLANVLSQQKRYDDAVAHYEAAVKLRPRSSTLIYNQALALLALGKPDLAIEKAREAVAANPQDAAAQHGLGTMLMGQDKAREAIGPLTQAVRLRASDARYREDLGGALLAAGDPGGAVRQLRAAVRLAPTQTTAHHRLGEALLGLGHKGDALTAYEAALAIDPGDEVAASYVQRLRGDAARP